jgi:hypothetical protein
MAKIETLLLSLIDIKSHTFLIKVAIELTKTSTNKQEYK